MAAWKRRRKGEGIYFFGLALLGPGQAGGGTRALSGGPGWEFGDPLATFILALAK